MCSFCTRLIEFEPAGDRNRDAVEADRAGRERDRLQARRALPVDSRSGRRHRQPGPHQRLAGDVVSRRALLHGAAHDDVLDLAGLDPRALDGVLDRMAAEGRAVRCR